MRRAVEAQSFSPTPDGWAELDVPIEEVDWASHELIKLGDDVEVKRDTTVQVVVEGETIIDVEKNWSGKAVSSGR